MAIDFDAVDDVLVTGLTSHATLRTYAVWAWRDGNGEGNLGRIFDKRISGGTEVELFYFRSGNYQYERLWTSLGTWTVTAPAVGAWNHLILTYDSGSTANDPVVYLNGSSVTVTETVAPSGTLQTNTSGYHIGNRGAADRTWDGRICEFVVYDRILTAQEASILYLSGPYALPYNLSGYWPLYGVQSPEPDFSGNNRHATVVGSPARIDHPPRIAVWNKKRYAQSIKTAVSSIFPGSWHPMIEKPYIQKQAGLAY